jgi:hypothetical protein
MMVQHYLFAQVQLLCNIISKTSIPKKFVDEADFK